VSPLNNRKASAEILWRLSENLKRLRKARGYTQERLGKRCGLTKNYISNVERGTVNISLANLEAIAIGLNCTAEDLLGKPIRQPCPPPVRLTGSRR
jgi:transcriptional regulator with XRE-family HTH domain